MGRHATLHDDLALRGGLSATDVAAALGGRHLSERLHVPDDRARVSEHLPRRGTAVLVRHRDLRLGEPDSSEGEPLCTPGRPRCRPGPHPDAIFVSLGPRRFHLTPLKVPARANGLRAEHFLVGGGSCGRRNSRIQEVRGELVSLFSVEVVEGRDVRRGSGSNEVGADSRQHCRRRSRSGNVTGGGRCGRGVGWRRTNDGGGDDGAHCADRDDPSVGRLLHETSPRSPAPTPGLVVGSVADNEQSTY
jgi:hypothetical protein